MRRPIDSRETELSVYIIFIFSYESSGTGVLAFSNNSFSARVFAQSFIRSACCLLSHSACVHVF